MRTYPCKVCNELLTGMMRQSGIRIDGLDLPAHVHCAEKGCSEEIEVWKVGSPGGGSYVEEFVENVLEVIKDMDDESQSVITKLRMTRGKYESLGEFKGF